jgi:hypothetical protein
VGTGLALERFATDDGEGGFRGREHCSQDEQQGGEAAETFHGNYSPWLDR